MPWTAKRSVLPQAVLATSLMQINLVATASNLSDWLWNAIFTAKFDKPDSRLHANEMSWWNIDWIGRRITATQSLTPTTDLTLNLAQSTILLFWSSSWSQTVSPQGTRAINPAKHCHYFPSCPRLPSQLDSITTLRLLGDEGTWMWTTWLMQPHPDCKSHLWPWSSPTPALTAPNVLIYDTLLASCYAHCPYPLGGGIKRWCTSDVYLSRTSGLSREQRGLGRPKLAHR